MIKNVGQKNSEGEGSAVAASKHRSGERGVQMVRVVWRSCRIKGHESRGALLGLECCGRWLKIGTASAEGKRKHTLEGGTGAIMEGSAHVLFRKRPVSGRSLCAEGAGSGHLQVATEAPGLSWRRLLQNQCEPPAQATGLGSGGAPAAAAAAAAAASAALRSLRSLRSCLRTSATQAALSCTTASPPFSASSAS